MLGKKFGRLSVIKQSSERLHGKIAWDCQCDCGKITSVITASLNNGNTKSCGCYNKQRTKEVLSIHGLWNHRLYHIWAHMIYRCSNPFHHNYKNYGARGIVVCEEWRKNPLDFYNWAMTNGYRDDLTIERVDNDGNYEPGNCRWATRTEQAQNKRTTILTEDDVRAIRKDLRSSTVIAEEYGVSPNTIRSARQRDSWKSVID